MIATELESTRCQTQRRCRPPRFHTPVSNHLYFEFGVHLQASIPNRTYMDSIDWLSPLFEKPLKVEDGWVSLPEEPGIGLRLDRKALDRYRAAA